MCLSAYTPVKVETAGSSAPLRSGRDDKVEGNNSVRKWLLERVVVRSGLARDPAAVGVDGLPCHIAVCCQ